jgi:3-oxo-4-pregnene-20-carboxyl-CoA dehydrogenase alpha subunit
LPEGRGVFLLDPATAGVSLAETPNSSGSPEFALHLDAVPVPGDALLGDDTSGRTVAAVTDLALAGAVAAGDGALGGALELTTTHLRTRHQFDKPLAAFQAVAQQIADVYITARTVHLAAVSAAWRLGSGLDARADLDLAAYWLAHEAVPAVQTCHHLHGGLGVDRTYPLHRFSSALKDLTRVLGGATHRLDLLGAAVRSG